MKAILLVLLLLFSIIPLQATEQQDTLTIDIGQSSWNKLTINVLVILNESQNWWQPYFPNMTVHAAQQWNDAFGFFADNYPSIVTYQAFNLPQHNLILRNRGMISTLFSVLMY
jgi:hypothetical protein